MSEATDKFRYVKRQWRHGSWTAIESEIAGKTSLSLFDSSGLCVESNASVHDNPEIFRDENLIVRAISTTWPKP